MNANIERVKQDPRCATFKAIKAATVREDWPDLREKAVAEVRRMIQEDAKSGRVLVIADRLYGSGPYKKLLNGLEFALNDKGLVHQALINWLQDSIGRLIPFLARPMDSADLLAQR